MYLGRDMVSCGFYNTSKMTIQSRQRYCSTSHRNRDFDNLMVARRWSALVIKMSGCMYSNTLIKEG